ncbi:DNA ligase [Thalassotalea sp. PLHSN55]|uniref:DNA ligase n=1 Tax=Thalassotalea sp. PLHSN55 TaxID=3435888 RepID=UPI003F84B6DA
MKIKLLSLIGTILLLSSTYAATTTVSKPPVQLATNYQTNTNISDYWISEKLDGIRGYWNGKQLLTRQGNTLHAPSWFIKNWPSTPLDGELWIARNRFEQVASCVLRKEPSNCWQDIRFMVFDLPSDKGTFTERIIAMKKLTRSKAAPYLSMVNQQKISNENDLYRYLDSVVADKGEGLMLHHKDAFYHIGRSKNIMKLKKHQDAEAKVIQHYDGKGKFQGMLGAILVETPQGMQFKIGSGFSNDVRKNPPKIGSTITYKYFGTTQRGIPKFASFVRERTTY